MFQPKPLSQGIHMENFNIFPVSQFITVPFMGATLFVLDQDGEPYVPMRPVVEGMGLDWKSQHAKLTGSRFAGCVVEITTQLPGGTQSRSMTSISLKKLPGWIMTIHPNKAKESARAKIIAFQTECDDILWKYWNDGLAVNPRAFAVNPGDTLTQTQQDTIRGLLQTKANTLPKAQQAAFMVKGWSKLKTHFRTSYRQIPQAEYSDALSIVARHTVEWELVDDEPKPRSLKNLPGLDFKRPPPVGTCKHNHATPYPKDGRTIEMAKSITADMRNWCDENLPYGQARDDMMDAANTLYDLLVSGWTEVDEALGRLHTAMHYLNRWQGRGGRTGNVG